MKKPTLTPSTLADDIQLHALIDELLVNEQRYWRFCRRILKLQLRHQDLASEPCFDQYLTLEDAINERHAWELALVARWAWEAGRRTT
jgi:hypothetical protein